MFGEVASRAAVWSLELATVALPAAIDVESNTAPSARIEFVELIRNAFMTGVCKVLLFRLSGKGEEFVKEL
jgi:hypothetical protein